MMSWKECGEKWRGLRTSSRARHRRGVGGASDTALLASVLRDCIHYKCEAFGSIRADMVI